ncbi:capsular polysaccharide transport system ATP-binding protein [Sphingobium vermicomposti]|uniref:Capsular polysaccharide transport system ATP-binding protein n=2 Tax=Sphingobium vermicomposti TaxID=529005 RepID=A0A846M4H3_9SPHN|nr:capsular polysaccharide transport system ATP-binding protein [Sphingobium vermicomposti]
MTVEMGEKVGVIGRNGAGKSTLIRLIGGGEKPTTGDISRTMSISWPIAFSGGFQSGLTGRDNLRFICRIYGQDPAEKLSFVQEFSELGEFLDQPIRIYSSGMKARLAFAISMAIDFDCLLIDEVMAVGDAKFNAKSREELFVKRAHKAMIIVSHNMKYIQQNCSRAYLMNDGKLQRFDDVEEAIATHKAMMA